MQFSPKKSEIYVSRLRNYIQGAIVRNGLSDKKLKALKKINIFSICRDTKVPTATDMAVYCAIVLYSAKAELFRKNLDFNLRVSGDAVVYADRKILCAVLCETAILCSKHCGEIFVDAQGDTLKITYTGAPPSRTLKRLLKAEDSVMLKIGGKNIYSIFLNYKTAQKSQKITGAATLLCDPLSPIKIFTSLI